MNDEAREIELQKLGRLERETWAAWERSQKPVQSAVISGHGDRKNERRSMKNQHGDPRFLEIVLKCIAQRRGLLGLDGSPIVEHETTPKLGIAERRARINALVERLRSRAGYKATEERLGGD